MESLDRHIGALIDIDGVRYRLAALDQPFALLTKARRPTGTVATTESVRMHVDDVAEAMTVVIERRL